MIQTTKRFEVRFQEVRAFAITVEARNDSEAENIALTIFKANPSAARLLRTEHGFFTIEDLSSQTTSI